MVKIGIIGVGKWGVNHLHSLHDIECDLVGISDVDVRKKDLARQYGTLFFEEYHELLKEIDAVTVTTPTDTHYAVVKECLAAGKHVLVEKPIAETSKQGKTLVELAQANNCVLSVGYLYRFNNAIRKTKEVLHQIGEIEYITCRYIHSTKPPRKDSGVIMNLGVHVVDMLNFLTGQVPMTVSVKKKNLLSKQYEDSASLVFNYKDFFATIELSCMHPEKARDLWIMGAQETMYVDYFNQKVRRFPLQVNYDVVDRREPFDEPVVVNEPLKEELTYFVDFLGKKNIHLEDNIGKENFFTTRICELCLKSAETGKEMKAQ